MATLIDVYTACNHLGDAMCSLSCAHERLSGCDWREERHKISQTATQISELKIAINALHHKLTGDFVGARKENDVCVGTDSSGETPKSDVVKGKEDGTSSK